MTIAIKSGKLILKGTKVATTCSCCGCGEDCCRTETYSYMDTEPKGKWYDECPNVGNCNGRTGSCGNAVLEGFIVERFCKASIEGKQVKAKLRANSAIDDFGSVAGIETDQYCGRLGVISGDHDITGSLVIEDDPDDSNYKRYKVPFRAVNANHGGPYGLAGVVICWCCIEQDDPPCSCCNTPPPPPPPLKYGCVDGECVEVANGTYDEPACGGECVECYSNADCGCVEYGSTYYPGLDEIIPGFGCCPQGTYFDPSVGYCWGGYPGSESAATESKRCCGGECIPVVQYSQGDCLSPTDRECPSGCCPYNTFVCCPDLQSCAPCLEDCENLLP